MEGGTCWDLSMRLWESGTEGGGALCGSREEVEVA